MRVAVLFCFAALALHVANAQICSGKITGVSWTIAATDRVPAGTTKPITVAFTIATALVATDTIAVTYPSGFITTAAVAATPTTLTAATPTATQVVLTVATGASFAAGATITVTLSGATMGGATAGSTCGITVGPTSTAAGATKDVVSAGVASGTLGGQVTGVSWTIAATDRVPAGTTKPITVAFTIATALVATDTIAVTYPSGFITTAAVTAAPITLTAATPTATQVVLTVATGASFAAGATITVTLSGATMGDITAGVATGITVGPTSTAAGVQRDRVSAGVGSGRLGGQVTGVSMNIAATDRIPLATNKPVTVSFTTATALVNTQTVVIKFPNGYLSGTIGVAFATANVFGANAAVTATTATLTVGSANANANTYTVTLTGVTMPGIMPAGCAASIWVSTTTDLRSVNSVTTQAFGGAVTGVSSSVLLAERVPTSTAKSITVSFTTQTILATNQLVNIVFPGGYFSSALSVTFAGTANTFATSTSAITNGVTIAVGSAGAAAGPYTVTLTGATIGGPIAATTNGVTVSTTTDAAGTGRTDALGGAVSNVAVTIVDRIPLATGKSVTVSFRTATALASAQLVTISFPSNFLTGTTIGVTFAGAANTFAATATAVGTGQLTILVGSAGAAATAYTLTLTGVTMPGPQAAVVSTCTSNFNVRTTTDIMGGTNTPQIGGIVSNVAFNVAAADRVPAGTGKTVTVSFTTQTNLASAQLVTIVFPSSYISGSIGVTFAGAANTFAATATAVGTILMTIAVGSAGAAAGPYTITLTGAVMGSPIAASTATGVGVLTSTDRPGTTGYPALGGGVTSATLTILEADRIVAANRRVVVSFSLATALVQNNKITVVLPAGFVIAVTAGAVTGITANAALEGSNIVLTAGAAVALGTQTVTICGVQLGSFTTNSMRGVSVMTTLDYSASCSATGIVGQSRQVTDVSMTIPFANRVAGNTAQSATFAFTTSTILVATAGCATSVNSITITFPLNFFADNAAGACGVAAATIGVTGLTGYTLTGDSTRPSTTTRFVFTGSATLAAGTQSVIISGLTLGAQTNGVDTGITVETSMDAVSVGAPSGPISGYEVTSATNPACSSTTCQNFVVAFSSTAGMIPSGGSLAITFTSAPVSGVPDAFMSGSALITGALAGNTLTLTVNAKGGAWNIGSTAVITLTGMTVQSTGLRPSRDFVSVGGSTRAFSAPYMMTGTGTTTTNTLSIARPFPGVTNTQMTITFTTTNGIAVGDFIRVFYPAGFLIGTPQTVTCAGSTNQFETTATGLGACSGLAVENSGMWTSTLSWFQVQVTSGGSAAGPQTIVVSGVTLSATAVAATPTFSVVTTANSCSAGAISTGAISNANPGGPGTPSSAVSWVPSVLAVIACALTLVL